MLIQFKNNGPSQDKLLTLYQLKIWCLAEFAATAFHGSLTLQQSNDNEMLQKKALAIILGSEKRSYRNALKTLAQDMLREGLYWNCIYAVNLSQGLGQTEKQIWQKIIKAMVWVN